VGEQRGEPGEPCEVRGAIAKACVAEPAEARLRYAVPKAAIAMAPAIVVVVVVTPLMSWA
jgi:hypothetical protein